jgi:hypothetical protein
MINKNREAIKEVDDQHFFLLAHENLFHVKKEPIKLF